MGRQAIRYGAAKPTSGPTAAVATMNARGVFDSIGDFGDGDDQATLMYQPQRRPNGARNASHFPPPVRAAGVSTKPAPVRARSSTPPAMAAVRQSEIPAAPRMPAIQLETIPARPPRLSITAAAESTPAVTFDADSGEYVSRTPTMPVPRMSTAPRANRLPYLAAGVLALAAGALVVLLAGIGKKSASSFPTSWETGAAASSALAAQAGAAHLAAAAAPPAVAAPAYAAPAVDEAQPVVRSAPRRVAARPAAAPAFVAPPKAAPPKAATPKVVAPKPAVASAPPPVAKEPKVAAKPAKADKAAKGGDEDLAHAQAVADEAANTLGNSL